MKHWLYLYGAAFCAFVSLSFLLIIRTATAEAGDFLFFPLPLDWIKKQEINLHNGDSCHPDAPGDGDEADVYYPELPSKYTSVRSFPIVAFLQGANVDKSQYEQFGRRLARFGFVVVIPNHCLSFGPPPIPPTFFASRTVILNVLTQMKLENDSEDSPLYQIVDTDTLALAGHSVGGVVGIYASAAPPDVCFFCDDSQHYERPPELRAAAFYGANLVKMDSDSELVEPLPDTTGIAIALVQGTEDGLATLQKAELTYPTLKRSRALITINGANHYGITDDNNLSSAILDLNTLPTLGQPEAVARIARWTGLWFRARLLRDPFARFFIYVLQGSFDEVVSVCTGTDISECTNTN